MLNAINRFSTLLGFEKTLAPMRAARAMQVLKKRFRYTFYDEDMKEIGKEVLSEAEFIVYTPQEGREPSARTERPCDKCTASYCVDENTCTRGKTKQYMWANKYGTEITKTGYDFANWLIAEGLISFDAVHMRIDAENAEKEKNAQNAAKKALEEHAAEAEEAAENKYSAWLNEMVRNYGGINTPEGAKILIQRDIFLDVIGEYHDRAKSLLVLIENIENPRCRRDIISQLHNENAASIKTFEHITGIKLAKTNKERAIQLEAITKADFAEQPKQYKPRKAAEEADYNSVFFEKRFSGDGKTVEFVEARGRLWKYCGYDFFIVVRGKNKKTYRITEGKTGMIAARGETLKEAQDAIRKLVNNISQTSFADMVNRAIEKNGISPLYK